jgi:cell division protease FtsH
LVFLGRDLGEQRNYSEEIASEIDSEVHRLVETAFTRSKEVLKEHEQSLHACSKRLIEIETMDAPEMDRIIDLTEGEGASKTKVGSNGSTPVIAATGGTESKSGSAEESAPAAG